MARILNFGSLNIDFVYEVEHFVRPGETVSSVSLNQFPGGKGLNQSVALARAGAEVFHAGAVGEDGRFLASLLREAGADSSHVRILSGRTGHAVIQVTPTGQNCILLHPGANRRLEEAWAEEALAEFREGDWLLLQNEISLNPFLMRLAREKGMRIALNPSPMDGAIQELPLEFVSLFFVNELEGEELTGEREPEAILRRMRERWPDASIVLTLGGDGALALSGEELARFGVFDVPVVDTTAAGDTFTGYYLAALAAGEGSARAVELASAASSIAVSRRGAAVSIPTRKEVLAFLKERGHSR